MAEFVDWFKGIPWITRCWFSGSVALPLAARLGLISPLYLILWPEKIFGSFHIWRPLTAALYFPMSFLYLVNLYFLYQYSTRLETGQFGGRPADYAFMLLFNWTCIAGIGALINMQMLMIPLVMSALYVWAQLNKDTIVSFWFGTRFKACYLPWVILVFNYIVDGSVVNELMGNLVGHLYWFLMFRYPVEQGGRSLLSTPAFLQRLLPGRRAAGGSGFGAPPGRRQDHNWGQGVRLGDN